MGEHPTNKQRQIVATTPFAIVGAIRFSMVLEDSNFFPPLSGQNYHERKARIFDRARLMRRFQLFEDVCLPSLTNQIDPNFNVMLATSRDLPDWATDRLMDLVWDLSNIYVLAYRSAANIRRVFKRSVFEMFDPDATICASFRLDDDDAIANDYIARLRANMKPANVGKVVTDSRGHQLALSDDTLKMLDDTRECSSAGLALIQKGGVRSIPQTTSVHCLGGHRKVGRFAPVINDVSASMYVQTANGVNVSERRGAADWDVISTRDMARRLQPKFPHLDEETLNKLHVVYPS